MTLRVGLFGCGRIASLFHGPILARTDGIRVVAIADSDPAARAKMSTIIPSATLFSDWKRPLALGAIDAAVICLPPSLHAPATLEAFETDAHVYVEKPLALSTADADQMIAARNRLGKIGMVGFNFRFHPHFIEARRQLQNGELGELQAIRTINTSERRNLPAWKLEISSGGGAFEDLATHHLDIIAFLTGDRIDPRSIQIEEYRQPFGSTASVSARLEKGQPVCIVASQTSGQNETKVQLLCEYGHLTINPFAAAPFSLEVPHHKLAPGTRIVRKLYEAALALGFGGVLNDTFETSLNSFFAAVRSGDQASPSFEDGRHVVELIAAAQDKRMFENGDGTDG